MKLFWNLVWNDIRKNRVISIVLLLFMILSALLMAGGLRVMGTMISATSGLNEAAMSPDYLKLHKGEYDGRRFRHLRMHMIISRQIWWLPC